MRDERRWDLPWKAAFLESLRRWPVIAHACRAAGVSRATVHRHRVADAEFAAAMAEALEDASDVLEAELMRRALGTGGPRLMREEKTFDAAGTLTGRVETWEQGGDSYALLHVLKAIRPEKWNPRFDARRLAESVSRLALEGARRDGQG